MKKKTPLNLALSIIIALCAAVCVVTTVSTTTYGPGGIFWFKEIGSGEQYLEEITIEWRIAAPLIIFASFGALLAMVKIFTCSAQTAKSSDKVLGITSVVLDIITVIGLALIAAGLGTCNGTFGENDDNAMWKVIASIRSLLLVGSSMMLIGGIGSWIANQKARE